MARGSADGMVGQALAGGGAWSGRWLGGAGAVLGLALLGGCTAAHLPPGPIARGGPLRLPAAAPAQVEPLVVELPREQLLALVDGDPRAARTPLPVLRPRRALILPSPAKPQAVDHRPRLAWLPELKPALAAAPPAQAPRTIWPPPAKPLLAFDRPDWAPAAGPEAPAEVPARAPDAAPTVVHHGLPPRHDAGRSIALADRDQQPESRDRSARDALLAGDALTALRLYERLAREFPAARSARLGQALALERLGRPAEARAVYQSLLEADPEDLGAKVALLGILAERAPDEALRLLRRLARSHPDDHRLAAQISTVLANQGELAAAIAAGRRAVALDPDNSGYRANLAVLYDRAGQSSAAVEHYQRALDLAILAGAPTPGLDAIAARLEHLRGARWPVPANSPR